MRMVVYTTRRARLFVHETEHVEIVLKLIPIKGVLNEYGVKAKRAMNVASVRVVLPSVDD